MAVTLYGVHVESRTGLPGDVDKAPRRTTEQDADNDPATTLTRRTGALSTTCVDPVITPSTFSAAAKVLAQQGVQFGKSRMRVKPTIQDRMRTYVRFQDAAVLSMSLIAASTAFRDLTEQQKDWQGAERFMVRVEERVGLLGQALREVFIVAPPEVGLAAKRVADALAVIGFEVDAGHLDEAFVPVNMALNEFLLAVRIDLRVDLPYRNRRWQIWRPRRPALESRE